MNIDDAENSTGMVRLSLSSVMLLMLAAVCAVGWFSTARRSVDVRARMQALEREVEAHRSGLPQIDVVDDTKVHALGLTGSGWLMYFPRRRYVIHGYVGPYEGDDLQGPFPASALSPPMELAQLCEFDGRIANEAGDDWALEFSQAGQVFRRCIPWKVAAADAVFDRFQIAPGQRAVWEPGESLTLLAQQLVGANGERGDVAAIWIEPVSSDAPMDRSSSDSTDLDDQP